MLGLGLSSILVMDVAIEGMAGFSFGLIREGSTLNNFFEFLRTGL